MDYTESYRENDGTWHGKPASFQTENFNAENWHEMQRRKGWTRIVGYHYGIDLLCISCQCARSDAEDDRPIYEDEFFDDGCRCGACGEMVIARAEFS